MALDYPDSVIPPLRFQYCPLCAQPVVRKVLFDDQIARITCGSCGWIQLISNALGVVTVARQGTDIVTIKPPNEDGVALPAGLVEYGEAPEEAAVREVREETGLTVEIVRSLGWVFVPISAWPGPIVQFMYEAEVTGGTLVGGDEGAVQLTRIDAFPDVLSSKRDGSQRAIEAFLGRGDYG